MKQALRCRWRNSSFVHQNLCDAVFQPLSARDPCSPSLSFFTGGRTYRVPVINIELCRLNTESLLLSRLYVLSRLFSVAVYYADMPFHAGLAGSHGIHLTASLHAFQPVDHLPKHHLSGGGESLPGPSSSLLGISLAVNTAPHMVCFILK